MEEGCAAKRILATEGTPPCGAKGSLDLALYNPCFSGMTIFYTVYKENLNSGHRCLNLVSQHLCIYFKKERGGSPRDFALLKTAGSNSVWAVQQRPSWGDFAKHFWLAVGMRPNVAARLASKTGLSFLAQDRMMWKKKCYTDFRNRWVRWLRFLFVELNFHSPYTLCRFDEASPLGRSKTRCR
jgi:hypothetical protein